MKTQSTGNLPVIQGPDMRLVGMGKTKIGNAFYVIQDNPEHIANVIAEKNYRRLIQTLNYKQFG